MKLIETSRFLKLALRGDAVVSGAVALLHVVAAGPLAEATHLPAPLFMGTGLFLFGYVAMLFAMAAPSRLWVPLVWLAIAGNAIWAFEALTLVAGAGGVEPNAMGVAWLILHAVTVIVFAVLHGIGLGRSPRVAGAAWDRAHV